MKTLPVIALLTLWIAMTCVSGNVTQAIWEAQVTGYAAINQYTVWQAKATVPWSVPTP